LVHRYRRELFSFLAHFLGDRTTAEDVFQETFLQVYRSAAGYDPSRRFRPWLFAIAANKARDWLRLQRRRPSVPLEAIVRPGAEKPQTYAELMEAPGEAPVAEMEKEELRRRVRETVLAMPERLREVLLLSFFHHFSYREIGDVLGIPLGTVKSRIHAAVAHFADRWHRLEETEGAESEAFALSAGTGAADPPPPETAAPDPAPPVRTARSVLRITAPSCSCEPPPDLVPRTLAKLPDVTSGGAAPDEKRCEP
jgi:RNA polymerase sigma-70 factor (ECF subfamily)